MYMNMIIAEWVLGMDFFLMLQITLKLKNTWLMCVEMTIVFAFSQILLSSHGIFRAYNSAWYLIGISYYC